MKKKVAGYRTILFDSHLAHCRDLRPAVVSMIASAGVLILVTAFWGSGIINIDGVKWDMVLIFAISVVLLRKTKWNPVFVMILAGVLKVLVALI